MRYMVVIYLNNPDQYRSNGERYGRHRTNQDAAIGIAVRIVFVGFYKEMSFLQSSVGC